MRIASATAVDAIRNTHTGYRNVVADGQPDSDASRPRSSVCVNESNDVDGNQIHEGRDGRAPTLRRKPASSTVTLICSVCGRSLENLSEWVVFDCGTRQFACSVDCRVKLASR